MKQRTVVIVSVRVAVVLLSVVGWRVWALATAEAEQTDRAGRAVPVEVADIERGVIERQRTFSGTLEALAEFRVAAKVGGRVQSLAVDLSDEVKNYAVVATLDSAE